MQDFSVEVVPHAAKDVVILRPKGSIDSSSTPILEGHFNNAIANKHYRIVLDLAACDFMSSAGLGLILGSVGTLRENDGDLVMMNVPEDISDIFEIMSIDDYFRIIDSLDELTPAGA